MTKESDIMKKNYLILASVAALALMAMSCSLPFTLVSAPNSAPQGDLPAGDQPPEGLPPEDRPPEGIPPQDQPPEGFPPGEQPPGQQPDVAPPWEPPGGGEARATIFGWDYSDTNNNGRHDAGEPSPGAGSIMPVYEGPCPSPNEVAKAQINDEGYYRIDDLPPGTYCVGALKTVTLEPGQQLEVSFPSPP
jgi:hypothetical protein